MSDLPAQVAAPTVAVFDLGGVLIDWDPRYLYRRLLPDEASVEWFLTEVCTPEWNREQDRGRPWEEAVGQLAVEFPAHLELITAYHERWEETVGGAIEDSVAVLRELRERGYPLYALTNFSTEKFAQVRERFGFLDWFDGIVVSAQERLVKPDPQLYQRLLARYGLDAPTTVYVDDLPVNVAAARSLGMNGLHFTTPDRLRTELTGLGLLNGAG